MDRLSVASGVGAVLATVAFMSAFMPWFGETFFGYCGITGWDIFYSGYNGFIGWDFSYYYLPALIGVMGVFAMIVFVFAPKGNVTVAVLAILGILMLALTCYMYTEFNSFLEDAGNTGMSIAFGFVAALISSAGVLVFGVVARR